MPNLCLRPLCADDLPAVLRIEREVHIAPWSEALFADCQRANYRNWILCEEHALLGYLISCQAFDEQHLLNVAVGTAYQGRGYGRILVEHFMHDAIANGMEKLLLEVRQSNAGAQRLYRRLGFVEIARRKAYYPGAAGAPREDAVVMGRNCERVPV